MTISTHITRLAKAVALALALGAALAVAVAPSHATSPGKNGLLVYEAQVGPHIELFTVRPGGTGARQVTHFDDSDAVGAKWSPTGKQIVFMRIWNAGQSDESIKLYTMNADGSGLRAVNDGVSGVEPNWFPDSKRIVFLTGPPDALGIINANGTGFRKIPIPGPSSIENLFSPVVSPDGKQIAFVRDRPDVEFGVAGAVFVVRLTGQRFTRIMPWSVKSLGDLIDWSPDGSRIVYSAPALGSRVSGNVFTIRADGKGPQPLQQLTHTRGTTANNYANSWSPDGKKIAFERNRRGQYQIYAMNADGTGVTQITHGGDAHHASWGSHP